MKAYRPRSVRFHQVLGLDGWRLKLYSISCDGSEVDWANFDGGLALVRSALPEPAPDAGRPGVGFIIAHHGDGIDYTVVSWWDRENELPTHVFALSEADGKGWRPASGGESFCVWDLEVIWAEREAYIQTYLAGEPPDAAGYLARHVGEVGPIAIQPSR
ncbi:MAG: isochorismatase [Gemmatimonadales bacterium]|nr:isochorismatase [Gemmatimonadales bacterium]